MKLKQAVNKCQLLGEYEKATEHTDDVNYWIHSAVQVVTEILWSRRTLIDCFVNQQKSIFKMRLLDALILCHHYTKRKRRWQISSLTFDRKKFQMVKVCIRANGFCSTIVHCKASPNIEFTGSIYIYPGVEMQNASEMPCPFTQHTVTLAKNRTRKRLIRRRAR